MLEFKKQKIPIKLHMGERKNKNYVDPIFIKLIVDELKGIEADPFLFDTTVAYSSLRNTKIGYKILAVINGFLKTGCKVIIGNKGKTVVIENNKFEIANELIETSNILVVSHVTGHSLAGFGGAIKNLGMGGVSKKTKIKIHSGSKPVFIQDRCVFCGLCEESCVSNAITVDKKNWRINSKHCPGCGNCIANCPNDALKARDIVLQKALALSTKAIVQHKKAIYVNVLKNITPVCDCVASNIDPLCSDIGYLISNDPVAIDKASIDLVNKHMKSDNIFKKITGVDPMMQIYYGEKIDLGSIQYRLIEL